MTADQFDALVQRLEGYAVRDPRGYRLRVGALAVLGYAYIVLVLLIVIGLLGACIYLMTSTGKGYGAIKIVLALGILALVILRSLWVSIPPPEGIALRRQEAPRLFEMVDDLSATLKTGRFEHVLLTPEFNAAAAQRPRLGVFGWYANYLLLGLPLMQGLAPDEFKAVVAHELGHLSGNHGQFGGWIYRVHSAWHQLLASLHESRGVAFVIFERFFRWYEPFFGAYSYVLRRQNEFEADRCAADLAGASSAAHALMNVQIRGHQLEDKFWPHVYEQVNERSEPPDDTYSAMSIMLQKSIPQQEAAAFLKQGMADREGSDTHPPLADRISAFGFPDLRDRLEALEHSGPLPDADSVSSLPLPPVPPIFAAEHYLGIALPNLVKRLDSEWKESIAESWAERHAYVQETRRKLDDLDRQAAMRSLTDEEAWDRAEWTSELRTEEEAIPLYRELAAKKPNDSRATFALGALLLSQGDESGIALIESAMSSEPDAVITGCEVIYAFLMKQGRWQEAERYSKRARDQYDRLMTAGGERESVSVRDRLEPHGLAPDQIESLRDQLKEFEIISAAYLARKALKHMPEKPLYVLAVEPDVKWYRYRGEDEDSKLVARLVEELTFPGETILLTTTGGGASAARKVRKSPNSEIYRK